MVILMAYSCIYYLGIMLIQFGKGLCARALDETML